MHQSATESKYPTGPKKKHSITVSSEYDPTKWEADAWLNAQEYPTAASALLAIADEAELVAAEARALASGRA